jgi:hypothetical protein
MSFYPVKILDSHGHFVREISVLALQLRNDKILSRELELLKNPKKSFVRYPGTPKQAAHHCWVCDILLPNINIQAPKICSECLNADYS